LTLSKSFSVDTYAERQRRLIETFACERTIADPAKPNIADPTKEGERLGYISTNLSTHRNAIDKYECNFSGKNPYPDIENIFLGYIEDKKEIEFLSFCCSYVDEGRDGKLQLSLRKREYRHRWAPSYKKRFLYRMHLLENWYRWLDSPISFLTVTTRQDMPYEEQFMYLKAGFLKIRDEYEKVYGKMSYLAALDFHKSGYAHYHVCVFAPVSPMFEQILKEKWSLWGFGDKKSGLRWKNKKNGEITKLVNYLFKHTAKVFSLNSPGALRFHSVIFGMKHSQNKEYPGLRLFSMSKDVQKVMKVPDSGTECISYTRDGELLYVNEDYGESGLCDTIEKYRAIMERLII